jgi:hypothetical protein
MSWIGDADQPVLGVPGIIAGAVRRQIAISIVGIGLARWRRVLQRGDLVEVVERRRLLPRGGIGGGGIARLSCACYLVFGVGRILEGGILAGGQAGGADL